MLFFFCKEAFMNYFPVRSRITAGGKSTVPLYQLHIQKIRTCCEEFQLEVIYMATDKYSDPYFIS